MSLLKHNRYLTVYLQELALDREKMAFLSGPRQAGKTTLAKQLLKTIGHGRYYNWDDIEFRRLWAKFPKKTIPELPGETLLVVYDEIHKAARWKGTLKGIYDTLETPVQILVTGSARLNIYRKGGDSLLGRYLNFRLHPFSLGEMLNKAPSHPEVAIQNILEAAPKVDSGHLESLIRFGGFPEPLFEGREDLASIWRRGRLEKIVREDLRDLSRIPELSQVEMLVALLEEKAGGVLSIESLREDLGVAHTTVQRWLNYLNQLYYCYQVRPYSRSVPRSLKKEGKLYLWDWSEIENNSGARFENMIAGHLLKACHFWTDIGQGSFDLFYLRNRDKNEIDFLVTKNKKPWIAVEAKSQDRTWSSSFQVFREQIHIPYCFQVVQKTYPKEIWQDNFGTCGILDANNFLVHLP